MLHDHQSRIRLGTGILRLSVPSEARRLPRLFPQPSQLRFLPEGTFDVRYIVTDTALAGNDFGWTPDSFAEALRAPMARIGLTVVRQSGAGEGGFHGAEHLPPRRLQSQVR